jgi:hypothetical protein
MTCTFTLQGRDARPFYINMNALFARTDGRTVSQLLAAGALTELAHLDADAQVAARDLEAELILDALAGVDLRARLIARACSI